MKQWKPVPNGDYSIYPVNPTYKLTVRGGDIFADWKDAEHAQHIYIGDFALCRLTDVPDVAPPREVVEALRLVLTFAKRDEANDTDRMINAKIAAALSWLAQWEGGGQDGD